MSNEQDCGSCTDTNCAAKNPRPGEKEKEFAERQALAARMCQIKHKIMVLSGKGGVGKSMVAVNLASALSAAGKRVGLLDIDIHGPSIPKLLHLEGTTVSGGETGLLPVRVDEGPGVLEVMSIGLLLPKSDDAVVWRGPMKYGVIKQFLKDVEWGELDYLIVDSPPGTGDEPLSVAQLIENADGALVVTTPQQIAIQDVRRSIMFCRLLDLRVLGVIENMSGFVCPKCGEHTPIFGADGGRAMAAEMDVPFLGSIPIDPTVVVSGDTGMTMVQCYPHSATAKAFGKIVRKLLEPELVQLPGDSPLPVPADGQRLKIAVPVSDGHLASHFGHCESFALFEVDPTTKSIEGKEIVTPPRHEPGQLPRWLHEIGTNVVITGGMGVKAQSLFARSGITVIAGAAEGDPEMVVRAYLDGALETGPNACDH